MPLAVRSLRRILPIQDRSFHVVPSLPARLSARSCRNGVPPGLPCITYRSPAVGNAPPSREYSAFRCLPSPTGRRSLRAGLSCFAPSLADDSRPERPSILYVSPLWRWPSDRQTGRLVEPAGQPVPIFGKPAGRSAATRLLSIPRRTSDGGVGRASRRSRPAGATHPAVGADLPLPVTLPVRRPAASAEPGPGRRPPCDLDLSHQKDGFAVASGAKTGAVTLIQRFGWR